MADSLNRRDIDMIFRAETDSATRSVKELKTGVAGLREELGRQIAAAEKGEVSLEDLARTTRELKRAQDELGTARSLLTQLNTLSGRAQASGERVDKLRAELTALQAAAAAADQPTKRLTNSITAKERALAGASERAQQDAAALADYKQEVEAIVGPVGNLEDAFRDVARTSKEVAQGLAISGEAADSFAGKIKNAAAAQASFDQFATFARGAGVLEEDIAFLAQFEDRIERVTQARNAQIAADLRFRDALEQTQAAQARVAQTDAFRQTAESAREAFRDVSRFRVETETADTSMRRLADAVRDLADPARAASQNLSDVADRVNTIADRVANGGSRRVGDLSQDLNDLEQALAGLQRQAQQVDGLREQQRATDAAEAAFARAKVEVFDLANALDRAGADATPDLVNGLRQAEASAEQAGRAFQQQATRLAQLQTAAEAASIDIRNLDAAQDRIVASATRAGQAAQRLRGVLGTGGEGATGFLGLRPFELQNLGFQINDIFVSLASGQNPLVVLTQQGSQIAQLFPGVWSALARGLPVIGPLVIALAALGAGFSRARAQAQELREARAAIAQLGDSANVTEQQIVTAIDRLDALGASGTQAKESILALVREGLDPAVFDTFSTAALNFSKITGQELPEATDRLIEGLTRGRDEVLALDNEFRFLSDSEREQIRAMDDSTDAAEIRTIAFAAFTRQAQEVAEELRGPSYDAVINLENAWSSFLDTLADLAGFDSVDRWLANLTNGLAIFTRAVTIAINRLRDTFGKASDAYFNAGGGVAGLFAAARAYGGSGGDGSAFTQATNELRLEQGERRFRQTVSGTDVMGNRIDPGAGTRGARRTRESVADRRQSRPSGGGRSEADKLADQLERDTERLTRAIEGMTAKSVTLQQQSVDEQLEAAAQSIRTQYQKLFRDLDEFAKTFGVDQKIGDMTQAQYRALLESNQKLLIQQQQLEVYETNLNQLLSERTQRLAQVEERQNANLITAAEAFTAAQEVTSELNPAIEKLSEDARKFAVEIGGANPSPELRAFLAKLDGTQITLGETRIDLQTSALGNLNELERQRNDIIQRRDQLVAANNQLVLLGLMTETDARQQAAEAYTREAEALRALIEQERAFLQLLLDSGIIDQTFFDARMAQLEVLSAQTQFVDDRILQINSAAQNAITQGFTAMFNSLAQGLANLITGGGDVGDMFENLGRTALEFAANFLKAIADVIVQMLALQAIRAIMGSGTGGIGGLFFHSGSGPGGVGSYGGGTRTRSNFSLSPLAVAAAPRYHNGTPGAGLKRNEMVAVLERGEKVTTEEQQRREARAAANQGSGGGRLRQVLAFGDDEIAGAMAGPAGEQVTVTHIRRNRAAIRQELGID